MAAAWGHRWTATAGESPLDERGCLTAAGTVWNAVLNDIPAAAITTAIADAIKSGSEWPPTLPEFLARAKLASPPSAGPAQSADRELEAARADLSHFERLNGIYRETHDRDIFDIHRCLTSRQKYLLGISSPLERAA